jgi:hypothetical protein
LERGRAARGQCLYRHDRDGGPISNANDGNKIRIHLLPVTIKVFLKAGTDAANARTAISDIFRAIRQDDHWIASGEELAMWTQQKSHAIEYTDGFEIVGAMVDISIAYHTLKFNAES